MFAFLHYFLRVGCLASAMLVTILQINIVCSSTKGPGKFQTNLVASMWTQAQNQLPENKLKELVPDLELLDYTILREESMFPEDTDEYRIVRNKHIEELSHLVKKYGLQMDRDSVPLNRLEDASKLEYPELIQLWDLAHSRQNFTKDELYTLWTDLVRLKIEMGNLAKTETSLGTESKRKDVKLAFAEDRKRIKNKLQHLRNRLESTKLTSPQAEVAEEILEAPAQAAGTQSHSTKRGDGGTDDMASPAVKEPEEILDSHMEDLWKRMKYMRLSDKDRKQFKDDLMNLEQKRRVYNQLREFEKDENHGIHKGNSTHMLNRAEEQLYDMYEVVRNKVWNAPPKDEL